MNADDEIDYHRYYASADRNILLTHARSTYGFSGYVEVGKG